MKRLFLCSLLIVLLLSMASCSIGSQFDGSRTGNDSRFIMDYKTLNTSDSQSLVLSEGDVLVFDIVSESGKTGIIVQKENDEAIYQGNDVPTSSFEVTVPETGIYTCTVTGQHAKGSVSIVKKDN